MLLEKIQDILFCPFCGIDSLKVINNKVVVSCCNRVFKIEDNQIIIFDDTLFSIPEVKTRDGQAKRYLTRPKLRTQKSIMQKWMSNIPNELLSGVSLDLGCGPGPTTKMLLESGALNILAADFSINSLKINKYNCQYLEEKPIYILQDVRDTKLKENSISVLVMADFLQHIIDKNERDKFLNRTLKSLIPGGYFFLSFFNINIKNYLKNDIVGSFVSGTIKYERLNYKDVINSFPENIIVERVMPMNISTNPIFDRLLCSLPFSFSFGRMVVIEGKKESDDN